MPRTKKLSETIEKSSTFNDLLEKYKNAQGALYSGIFLLGFIMGALIASVITVYFIRVPKNDTNNDTISAEDQIRKDNCQKQGGNWEISNGSSTCSLPTNDSGKVCSKKADCTGWCLAEDNAQINTKASGKCSSKSNVEGCIKFIDNGTVNSICMPK